MKRNQVPPVKELAYAITGCSFYISVTNTKKEAVTIPKHTAIGSVSDNLHIIVDESKANTEPARVVNAVEGAPKAGTKKIGKAVLLRDERDWKQTI